MALTPAEKMQAYRKRLRARGGKVISLTLSPEEIGAIEIIGEQNYPEFALDEVVRAILNANCARLGKIVDAQIKLRDGFNANDKLINAYVENEKARARPMEAEDFLATLVEMSDVLKELSCKES